MRNKTIIFHDHKLVILIMVNKILNIPSGWNLLKRIPRIIFEWKLMSPKQKWCYLYGIYKTSLMRFPFYGTSRTEVHWFSYFILFYSFVLGILMLYTFYYYLPRGDLLSCFPCTCLIGILTAVNILQPIIINSGCILMKKKTFCRQ